MINNTKTPLNLVRTFISAGEHLSFKLAAEELCITPPAISQQIKQLEELLGIQLFIRGNRELSFTKAGEIYWQSTNRSVTELDQATASLQKQYGQSTLSISVLPPLAASLVIPNLESFQRLFPDVCLRIESNIKNVSIERGEADIAIRFGDGSWSNVICEKLLDLYIQPVFPPFFASRYDLTSMETLRTVPLVHMTARPGAWQRWFKELGLGAPNPEQEYHLDDYPSAIEAAKHLGAALALMPVEKELVSSGSVIAPIAEIGPIDEAIYAIYNVSDKDNPTIQAFLRWFGLLLKSSFSK